MLKEQVKEKKKRKRNKKWEGKNMLTLKGLFHVF